MVSQISFMANTSFDISGDQFMHIKKMVDRGFAIRMDKNDFTEEQLLHNINELLHNDTYTHRAKQVAKIVNDKVLSSEEILLFYIGYIARHGGVEHLISDAANQLNVFQYLSLDVLLFVLTIFGLVLGSMYLAVKRIFCSFSKAKHKKD